MSKSKRNVDGNAESIKQIANAMIFDELETLMPQNSKWSEYKLCYIGKIPTVRVVEFIEMGDKGNPSMIIDREDRRVACSADRI
jgi:hypothetical protein